MNEHTRGHLWLTITLGLMIGTFLGMVVIRF
jgi:uncharacterized membrane-anchored protein YhcB (DUF1043 family)